MSIKLIALAVTTLVLSNIANAATILLAESSSGMGVYSRLEGLGNTVTISDASTWGATFDYSSYDVVAFQFGSSDPSDITNFVNAVDNKQVGTVFFRGYGAESTANSLGLINDSTSHALWFQSPATINILNNSHDISSGLSLGENSLGYKYMSNIANPGINTTTLGVGSSGAALVVHNDRNAVITPFFGHNSNYHNETQIGLDITQRSIEWAAGIPAVPVPAAAWLFASGLLGLIGIARRKKT